jgi:hypothetical protein
VRPGWESLRDGWRFLRRAPNIRLQGVFIVVVAGGPRVGALYAGTLATLTALWFPPLLGGMAIIAIVALLVRANPRFRAYDADHPSP